MAQRASPKGKRAETAEYPTRKLQAQRRGDALQGRRRAQGSALLAVQPQGFGSRQGEGTRHVKAVPGGGWKLCRGFRQLQPSPPSAGGEPFGQQLMQSAAVLARCRFLVSVGHHPARTAELLSLQLGSCHQVLRSSGHSPCSCLQSREGMTASLPLMTALTLRSDRFPEVPVCKGKQQPVG